tara:strand:+ start:9075 stop:9497 length:423 start_codon:yes stop_codon:yes gene_type:complete
MCKTNYTDFDTNKLHERGRAFNVLTIEEFEIVHNKAKTDHHYEYIISTEIGTIYVDVMSHGAYQMDVFLYDELREKLAHLIGHMWTGYVDHTLCKFKEVFSGSGGAEEYLISEEYLLGEAILDVVEDELSRVTEELQQCV